MTEYTQAERKRDAAHFVRALKKATQPSEAQIERTCSDYLALDGWRCLKTDPCSDRSRGKGFGEKGMADTLFIRYGSMRPYPASIGGRASVEVLWLEWKTPKGRVAPHQHVWHECERARGALTLIAGIDFPATIEGFRGWYKASGLARRIA